jgi:hypothetical protein
VDGNENDFLYYNMAEKMQVFLNMDGALIISAYPHIPGNNVGLTDVGATRQSKYIVRYQSKQL